MFAAVSRVVAYFYSSRFLYAYPRGIALPSGPVTFTALVRPLSAFVSTLNSTAVPSSKSRNPSACTELWCTKKSSPSSRVRNPNPFLVSNHFTVPLNRDASDDAADAESSSFVVDDRMAGLKEERDPTVVKAQA